MTCDIKATHRYESTNQGAAPRLGALFHRPRGSPGAGATIFLGLAVERTGPTAHGRLTCSPLTQPSPITITLSAHASHLHMCALGTCRSSTHAYPRHMHISTHACPGTCMPAPHARSMLTRPIYTCMPSAHACPRHMHVIGTCMSSAHACHQHMRVCSCIHPASAYQSLHVLSSAFHPSPSIHPHPPILPSIHPS